MDMTLDYNIELFPLETGQHFALALASSLARGGQRTNTTDGAAEEEEHVWRPDGKGQRGLEEDYDYVMYGKVCSIYSLRVLQLILCRCISSMAELLKLCTRSFASSSI